MFVLDTDVISQLARRRPDPNVVSWLAEQAPADITTTTVTIEELKAGIENIRRQDADRAALLDRWLMRIVTFGQPQILADTPEAALLFGAMRETPALRNFVFTGPKAGKLALGNDLRIAAIAICHRATVVSGNIRHFLEVHERFPLPGLFDVFRGIWAVEPGQDRQQRLV
ncbi:MAG: hypothetical protein OJJ21_14165 [Ferrovibrio sp.]|uniref:hypothetical protein n=1 Tax=Ferrovibrio sp. TaxID=1917215 RepID=UPI002610D20F|nr:hypothetical protein [Ferrovibrio sp.]MCW0234740.1 hypothetical protein [Ferrovibrio sp.]